MKKILNSYGLDQKEQYNILNNAPEKLSKHIGETFQVKAWALTETVDDDGVVSNGFTFVTPDGEYYGTGGKAFCEGIQTFLGVFAPEELTAVTVGVKTSRAGRDYLVFIA